MALRAERIAPLLDIDVSAALFLVKEFWDVWRGVYASATDHREPDGAATFHDVLGSRGMEVRLELAQACWREMRVSAREYPFELFTDTHASLSRARALGLSRALVTNNYRSELLRGDLQEYGISLHVVICSADVGWRKPHRLIFSRALQSLGVPPEDVVMVGDNFENDVLGAKAIGMPAVLKLNGREATAEEQAGADFLIDDLSELFSCGVLASRPP
jgi:FMN phosphatase YigB (HAD superfamily)